MQFKATEKRLFSFCTESALNWKKIKCFVHDAVDINCRNKEGLTPLLYFLKNDKAYTKPDFFKILKFLVEKRRSDVNATTSEGCNALHLLCQHYSGNSLIDLIKLLIKHNIEVNHPNDKGQNALYFLCYNYKNEANKFKDIVQLLIKKGSKVHQKLAKIVEDSCNITGNLDDVVKLLRAAATAI